MNEQYINHCRDRFDRIEGAINRVSEVVFDGYGESIHRTDERVGRIEEKIDKLVNRLGLLIGAATGSGAIVGFIVGLVISVVQ
jgi:archaellum component FlaC